MSLLAVESLEVRYGRTRAVQNLSLTLDEAMFEFKPPPGAEVLNDFDTGGAQ